MDLLDTLQYLSPETNPNNFVRFDGDPFTKNFIDVRKNKVSFRGMISFRGFEKFGIFVMYFIGPLIIYYLPLRGIFFIGVKLMLIILSIYITRMIMNRYCSIKFLEINNQKKELKSTLEAFSVQLKDIHEMSIIEETYLYKGKESMRYKIHFSLQNGEKDSIFSFTSYDSANEVLEIIKKSISALIIE
ncbi:MAG TPA: hypothetical protein VM077_00105 [Candidatus Limnocylindrales bacterium]|nr:hypothetical protein [Candidatus Limnocylindrales bacterium]